MRRIIRDHQTGGPGGKLYCLMHALGRGEVCPFFHPFKKRSWEERLLGLGRGENSTWEGEGGLNYFRKKEKLRQRGKVLLQMGKIEMNVLLLAKKGGKEGVGQVLLLLEEGLGGKRGCLRTEGELLDSSVSGEKILKSGANQEGKGGENIGAALKIGGSLQGEKASSFTREPLKGGDRFPQRKCPP